MPDHDHIPVSVVVPVFNRAGCIRDCIDSIRQQTHQTFEVIVVDDCSTDDTQAVVEAIGDSRIRVLSTHQNSGPAHARNIGIKNAKHDWFAFLDSDDLWMPEKLALQLSALDKHGFDPWVVVYTSFVVKDFAWSKPKPFPSFQAEGTNAYPELLENWGPLFQSLLVSRIALSAMDYIDEDVASWEDWDLAIRLSLRCNMIYLREPLFEYHLFEENRFCRNRAAFRQGYYDVLKKHEDAIKQVRGPAIWQKHIIEGFESSLKERLPTQSALYLREIRKISVACWLRAWAKRRSRLREPAV